MAGLGGPAAPGDWTSSSSIRREIDASRASGHPRPAARLLACARASANAAHDLATRPSDPAWRDYCPNATTLDALDRRARHARRHEDGVTVRGAAAPMGPMAGDRARRRFCCSEAHPPSPIAVAQSPSDTHGVRSSSVRTARSVMRSTRPARARSRTHRLSACLRLKYPVADLQRPLFDWDPSGDAAVPARSSSGRGCHGVSQDAGHIMMQADATTATRKAVCNENEIPLPSSDRRSMALGAIALLCKRARSRAAIAGGAARSDFRARALRAVPRHRQGQREPAHRSRRRSAPCICNFRSRTCGGRCPKASSPAIPTMPQFRLEPDQIADVIAYLETLEH